MSTALQTDLVTRALAALPPEKARELVDFAIFLQRRYGNPSQIEYDDTWSEEDMRALSNACLEYAERTILKDDPPYDLPTV